MRLFLKVSLAQAGYVYETPDLLTYTILNECVQQRLAVKCFSGTIGKIWCGWVMKENIRGNCPQVCFNVRKSLIQF